MPWGDEIQPGSLCHGRIAGQREHSAASKRLGNGWKFLQLEHLFYIEFQGKNRLIRKTLADSASFDDKTGHVTR